MVCRCGASRRGPSTPPGSADPFFFARFLVDRSPARRGYSPLVPVRLKHDIFYQRTGNGRLSGGLPSVPSARAIIFPRMPPRAFSLPFFLGRASPANSAAAARPSIAALRRRWPVPTAACPFGVGYGERDSSGGTVNNFRRVSSSEGLRSRAQGYGVGAFDHQAIC
jgi:hypothetical protein